MIAEIGINHNGDINIAKELISMAKSCDYDAVKFQKRDIETVYSDEILSQKRESPWGTTQREQKLGLEFSEKEYSPFSPNLEELFLISVLVPMTSLEKD